MSGLPTSLDELFDLLDWPVSEGLLILLTPANTRATLKALYPNRYRLYSAAWRCGFVVNGVPANG